MSRKENGHLEDDDDHGNQDNNNIGLGEYSVGVSDTVLAFYRLLLILQQPHKAGGITPFFRDEENEHRKDCARVGIFLPGLVAEPSPRCLHEPVLV